MSIPTSRTLDNAVIQINESLCTGCGLCVMVCKDFSLKMDNGKAAVSESPLFGCIGCGHCMAICPDDAIEIFGRDISPENMFQLPPKSSVASYDQLLGLQQRRRSIREFTGEPVEKEIIQKIMDAARTAPMGLPPSDVHALVFETRNEVDAFVADFCNYIENLKWMTSGWFLTLMRPIWGKINSDMFRQFIGPLIETYTVRLKNGENLVTYNAPAAIYFYGSPFCDPADPVIAATYAMVAAETLGLGTCMLGGIHPLIQYGGKARKLRQKYGIKFTSREGLFVIFGHPKVKFRKGIKRTFASDGSIN